MNQILLGISFPFTIALVIYMARRCRASLPALILTPVIIIICAVWAVAPDFPRMWGDMDLYYKLESNPRCDIFFWHYTIDKIESDSYMLLYTAGYVLIFALILGAAWRELYLTEKE